MKIRPNKEGKERLIFALDLSHDISNTMEWVILLKNHVGIFKIGKEAFTHFGPKVISETQQRGGRVFLDLKFHDIPNTVARAAEVVTEMNVAMFTIHALGGKDMMKKTVVAVKQKAAQLGIPMPVILAVTVLTSLNDGDLKSLGFNRSAEELALSLAKLAQDAGVSGVVASPHDVIHIRKACGNNFTIVTPGIRMDQSLVEDDQKRTSTPKEAIKAGADFLVVGRPIRKADNPQAVADAISNDISRALKK